MRTSSAKGAKYVSQGQVRAKRSTTPLDRLRQRPRALKVRNRNPLNPRAMSLLQSSVQFGAAPRGGALRYCSALPPQRGCRAGDPGWPLATLFRAKGAKSKARCINALHFQIEFANDKWKMIRSYGAGVVSINTANEASQCSP